MIDFPTDTQRIGFIIRLETALLSILILISFFRLFDYLGVFKQISRLVVMMEMMLRELASFLWIFVIVLIGFSVSEYIAYGYRDPDGYTIVFGFVKRVSQTFGGRDIVATGEDRILVSDTECDAYLYGIYV